MTGRDAAPGGVWRVTEWHGTQGPRLVGREFGIGSVAKLLTGRCDGARLGKPGGGRGVNLLTLAGCGGLWVSAWVRLGGHPKAISTRAVQVTDHSLSLPSPLPHSLSTQLPYRNLLDSTVDSPQSSFSLAAFLPRMAPSHASSIAPSIVSSRASTSYSTSRSQAESRASTSKQVASQQTTTGTSSNDERYVIAVHEQRGVGREIGLAMFQRDLAKVILTQFSDSSTCVKATHLCKDILLERSSIDGIAHQSVRL